MKPELKDIKVKDLVFDPQNPRLPNKYKEGKPEDVIRYFILKCNLLELMMSIGEKGYFSGEPLMVVPEDHKYIVVEGNRRLAALKLLTGEFSAPVSTSKVEMIKNGAKHNPEEVPTLVFNHRDDILLYLGYRHITGIKEWDALAKARYLKQLRGQYSKDDHELAHKELAKEIGSKANAVARSLTGLEILRRAEDIGILQEINMEADDIPFSLLTTGIGWQEIANFIGLENASDVEAKNLNEDTLKEFFSWTFYKYNGTTTVLGESRNFSKLARVVSSEEALKALRRGESLDEADLLTSGPLQTIRNQMFSAEKALNTAQSTLSIANGLDNDDLLFAEKIRKKANSLYASIRAEIEGDDF
ncbi:ParB/RepB/Spo0J family partition protein [Marinobacter nauticus]|uniref:ParB/RepB/Spo0J family partition protein n=1 Tax=Marinobacter nauticus TaxID=2743 RepID=UPI001C59543E|nr:ParB/Srx family N-terminal domain-containing protein [Marinobacter nauticus]MBW3199004.1 ParB/Srx family N-terminal domain-containing protein [Marinobacter nauticus]MBY6184414.1 ParB/Srx family N-terminal domain-containing protein [Marinobacter nauticus]